MEFHEAVAQLDTLVETLEREGDERALLLLDLIDAVHRPALELIARGETDHPQARALLAMYELAEPDEQTRAEEALDEVRAYVESHGGTLEVLGVEAGVVSVRLGGSCRGCAGSAVTLRRGVEESLRASFPGFRELRAEEAEEEPQAPGPKLLQLEDLRRPVFADVPDAPAPGQLAAVSLGDASLLLANLEGEVYAFRNGCAVDGLPLEGARLSEEGVIVCPWHNCAYDARSGRRLDDPDAASLAVVPVALESGSVRVAVNVA